MKCLKSILISLTVFAVLIVFLNVSFAEKIAHSGKSKHLGKGKHSKTSMALAKTNKQTLKTVQDKSGKEDTGAKVDPKSDKGVTN